MNNTKVITMNEDGFKWINLTELFDTNMELIKIKSDYNLSCENIADMLEVEPFQVERWLNPSDSDIFPRGYLKLLKIYINQYIIVEMK